MAAKNQDGPDNGVEAVGAELDRNVTADATSQSEREASNDAAEPEPVASGQEQEPDVGREQGPTSDAEQEPDLESDAEQAPDAQHPSELGEATPDQAEADSDQAEADSEPASQEGASPDPEAASPQGAASDGTEEGDEAPLPNETGSFELESLVGAHFAHTVKAASERKDAEAPVEEGQEAAEPASDGVSPDERDAAPSASSEASPDLAAANPADSSPEPVEASPAAEDSPAAENSPAGPAGPEGPSDPDAASDAAEPAPSEEPVEAPEVFVPIITESLPSYDEEHGRAIHESYQQDFSRLDRAYQPEPERTIRIPHIADEDGAGHVVPGEGKSRGKARPVLAFLLVAIMVVGVVAAGSYGLELWGGKHVPNVVGLSEKQAREDLEKNFTVETSTKLADDGIGYVLEQNPPAGQRIEPGSKVAIVIATSREMPDVVGKAQEEAESVLREAGAEEIKVELKNAKEAEGTVIATSPAPGEGFSAHQTIKLTVASKEPVPDVVGKTKVEAVSAIENAGYVAKVSEVDSDKPQNTVIEVSPAAGTKLNPGDTVTIKVAKPKQVNPLHVVDYFARTSQDIAKDLPKLGFSFNSGHALGDGYGEAEYVSTTQGRLIFSARPYSHLYVADGKQDVLTEGLKYRGIRWEMPASMLPADAANLTEAATESIMKTCGLTGKKDACTQDDIVIPPDAVKTGAKFRCTYGEQGDITWTVLLVTENGSTRAAVTCAPKKLYDEWYDLEEFGGSVCDMVAYADVYTELD